MSARAEELLGDYASESSEHISELESLLLGAERESPSPEAISAILRCFHSLKGLSSVVGASALEKVAHSAETVMSSVRSGQLIFEGDVLEVLLRVLDIIRGLRAELLEGRTVTEAPGDILLALEAFGGASNDRSPETTRIRVADRGSELHPDHELLVCLSELLAEVLPELAPLIEPDTDVRFRTAGNGPERSVIESSRDWTIPIAAQLRKFSHHPGICPASFSRVIRPRRQPVGGSNSNTPPRSG